MQFLGVAMFVAGLAASGYCVRASYQSRRPRDVAFAVMSPIALVIALAGLLITFVPGFFSS